MTSDELRKECDECRYRINEAIRRIEQRLTTLETTLWGKGGENGIRGSIHQLQQKMDTLLRFFWVATAIPAITVAVLAVLKFLGRL